jgi:hypothetical protein
MQEVARAEVARTVRICILRGLELRCSTAIRGLAHLQRGRFTGHFTRFAWMTRYSEVVLAACLAVDDRWI